MRSLAWLAVGAAVLSACAAGGDHGSTGAGGDGAGASGTTSSGGTSTSSGTSGSTSGGTTSSSTSGSTGTSSSSSTSGTSSGGTSSLTIYVTPDTSVIGQMVSAIQSATTSVYMTMYILDNSQIVSALVAAKQAGRDVKVVMNQTFPSGTVQSNPTTYSTLTGAGIGVVWRNGPPNATAGAYTHEKTFILDGKTAWIMTINLDASSAKYNREYIAVDTDATDAAEAQAIFLADFNGTSTSDGAPLVVSPNNSRSDLVSLINASTKTLDVEVEEFSDSYTPGITTAVAAAAKRGVATRVIVANDTPFTTAQTTAVNTVKTAGAKVVISGGTSGASTSTNPYIHAKAITIDCNGTTCVRGFIGSENFSAGSLGYNRELGIMIDNATELAKVQTAINTDFAAGTAQ